MRWDHCSGYHYTDNVVVGFSHTHLQGTGGIDLGDVLVMPVVEGRNWSWDAGIPRRSGRGSDRSPWTELGLGFQCSGTGISFVFLTRAGSDSRRLLRRASAKHRMCRRNLPRPPVAACTAIVILTLPPQTRQGVIVDLAHGLGGTVYHAELNIESDSRISGKRYTHGWAADKQVYFVIEFSQPAAPLQVNVDGKISSASAGDRVLRRADQGHLQPRAGVETADDSRGDILHEHRGRQ